MSKATRIYIGSDHAGFELKAHLVDHLKLQGWHVTDCGPLTYDPEDDYPPYCLATAEQVVADSGSLGIVLGGSGNGEQIAANKVRGVRAALAWNIDIAKLAREHNNANVLSLGARSLSFAEATAIVEAFLATEFSGAERHIRRIKQLFDYETNGVIPKVS